MHKGDNEHKRTHHDTHTYSRNARQRPHRITRNDRARHDTSTTPLTLTHACDRCTRSQTNMKRVKKEEVKRTNNIQNTTHDQDTPCGTFAAKHAVTMSTAGTHRSII